MNTDQIVTASSISSKIVAFFIFAAIEIICNTLTFFLNLSEKPFGIQDGALNNSNFSLQIYITYAMLGLQVIMHFCFIFWFFFLIWKTFLFKFGLLGKLMKREFPILLVVPFNFLFFIIETVLRVYYLLVASEPDNVVTVYNRWLYHIFFWTRHFFTILVFAAGLKAGIYIAHPSYYKPQKWLL